MWHSATLAPTVGQTVGVRHMSGDSGFGSPALRRQSRQQDCLPYMCEFVPLLEWIFTSMSQSAIALKTTPLNQAHRRLGGKMIDFGGWNMPVQYSGILDEHKAVRESVGIFDVSHMGEIEIRGPEALTLTDYVTTNAASKLKIGQAQYSGLLY